MNDDKYALEKEQIAEAEKALEQARTDFESARIGYEQAADALIAELEEFTTKKRKRIRFTNA